MSRLRSRNEVGKVNDRAKFFLEARFRHFISKVLHMTRENVPPPSTRALSSNSGTSSRMRAGRAEFPDRSRRISRSENSKTGIYLRNQESLPKGGPRINPGKLRLSISLFALRTFFVPNRRFENALIAHEKSTFLFSESYVFLIVIPSIAILSIAR